jgi:CubicO group peptidase (beta-lactamase class C family)
LAQRHAVPGASLAVCHDGDQVELVTGIANLNTGIPVTPDTGFAIASVSKIFTATAIMRLVHQGRLALDVPITTYLPDLKLADQAAQESITLRHLLTHTAGILGDNFVDHGRGDGVLATFVGAYADIPQVFPPGTFHSYANAGFTFMARIAEVVQGETWESVLRHELLEPLQIAGEAVTLPEEALLRRTAIGHLAGADGPVAIHHWELRRAQTPSGGVIATARSLLALARLHIQGGKGPDGTTLIAESLIDEMHKPVVTEPGQAAAFPARGLAWSIDEIDGRRILSHGGNTAANTAHFSVIPSEGFAFALLTNAGAGTELISPLFKSVVSDVLGIDAPPTHEEEIPTLPDTPPAIDLAKYVGEWEQLNGIVTVEQAPDGLVWSSATKGDMRGLAQDIPPVHLRPINAELFVALIPTGADPVRFPMRFLGFDGDGRPEFVHLSGRILRRTK